MPPGHSSDSVIKVAIADDHALFRSGVISSLSSRNDIQMVAEAQNGMQLLNLLRHIQPNVVLLDIQMPIMDGLSTLPKIKELYPDIRVIMMGMHNDPKTISKMMEINANSYLTKEVGSEAIYEAIRGVFLQDSYFKSVITANARFTEQEITILKLMCDEKSMKEIADIVDLNPRTVEAIRDKMKTKTGTKSTAGLVMYAVKTGLVEQH